MPNSSSNIEIVVEHRRFGRAAPALRVCDVWEDSDEKSIGKSLLFGSLWNNRGRVKRSEIAQRARRKVAGVCILLVGAWALWHWQTYRQCVATKIMEEHLGASLHSM
jgi:hypothetical protein